jgi:hypothetical protein
MFCALSELPLAFTSEEELTSEVMSKKVELRRLLALLV